MSSSDSLKPVQHFEFPFALAQEGMAEELDVGKVYFEALAKAKSGHYLLGKNGQFHSGVHFDAGTASLLDQEKGIRCIADGELVAWRIDKSYQQIDFSCGKAKYSTGFALVRHRLEVPTEDDTSDKDVSRPSLTFYSLYMHLADWQSYLAHPNRARAVYWGKGISEVSKPEDSLKGYNLRGASSYRDTYKGLALHGAILELGDAPISGTTDVYPVKAVVSGTVVPADLKDNLSDVVIWKGAGLIEKGNHQYQIAKTAKDQEALLNLDGATSFAVAAEANAGANLRSKDNRAVCLGFLLKGARVELGESVDGQYHTIKQILTRDKVIPESLADDPSQLVVWRDELTDAVLKPEQNQMDRVIKVDPPQPVNAGDILGQMGQYQGYEDVLNSRGGDTPSSPLVHLEVFTTDDVDGFLAASREYAASLTDVDRQLLYLKAGASLNLLPEPDLQLGENQLLHLVSGCANDGWVRVQRKAYQLIARSDLAYDSQTDTYTLTIEQRESFATLLGESLVNIPRSIKFNGFYYRERLDSATIDRAGNDYRLISIPIGEPVWSEWVDDLDKSDHNAAVTSGTALWSENPLEHIQSTQQIKREEVLKTRVLAKSIQQDDGISWWEVTLDTVEQQQVTGWVKAQRGTDVELCSLWDWPGFEVLEQDDTSPEALYARHAFLGGNLLPEEKAPFASLGKQAEQGAILKTLIQRADVAPDDAGLHNLSAMVGKESFIRSTAGLIAKHPSEWAEPERWDGIDSLMPDESKADWEAEKQRIKKMAWWKEGLDSEEEPVSSLNFIKMVENVMASQCGCRTGMTVSVLESIAPDVSKKSLVENTDSLNEAYSIYEAQLRLNFQVQHLTAKVLRWKDTIII